jgi:hypothetical protein
VEDGVALGSSVVVFACCCVVDWLERELCSWSQSSKIKNSDSETVKKKNAFTMGLLYEW